MSENFNEQNENNQNEYGTSQNIYGNTQTTYGDTQNSYGSENNYGGTQNSYGGTQNTYGYNNQPQYQSGMENQQQELVPQMSVGQWMLTYLLVNIPIVNIVMYIIWLIGKNPNGKTGTFIPDTSTEDGPTTTSLLGITFCFLL